MNAQVENKISQTADEARARYRKMLADARVRTVKAAGAVSKGKEPVQAVSKAGLKISAISHKMTEQVLKQQTRLVEHQIDAFAGRLRAAAEATNLREFVETQLRLIPQNASRFVEDTRETVTILADAGQQVGEVVKGTVLELRGRKPAAKAAKKPARKASARKTAKKTAKKAVAKKSPAKAAPAAPAEKEQQAA